VASAAADLYLGKLEDFVSRRNALAKDLRKAGDEDEAERVAALKKPSRVAWELNRVSANEAKLRDELLDAAAALAKAQERLLAGKAERSDLREAAEREQAAVGALLDATDLSAAAGERARQTLHAVALDEDVRGEFKEHRLVTDHEVAALGGLTAAGGKPKRTRAKPGSGDAKKRKEAQLAAREAETRLSDAEREAGDAAAAAERAQRRLREAERVLAKATKNADAAKARLT
jgi:hypothetical protein